MYKVYKFGIRGMLAKNVNVYVLYADYDGLLNENLKNTIWCNKKYECEN